MPKHTFECCRAAAERAGQGHLFEQWSTLDPAQQNELLLDVQNLDLDYINRTFQASVGLQAGGSVEEASAATEPASGVLRLQDVTEGELEDRRTSGLQLIAQGKVAVLLLAGGQGTRLGSPLPKGCYDVSLPSHKTLFQLHAERVLQLQRIAAAQAHGDPSCVAHPLQWCIMTSPFTHAATLAHLQEHHYWGLHPDQVHLFQQGFLPCLTPQGSIIMESPSRVSRAPDGNGSVYLALVRSGCLRRLQDLGVECVDCCSVDNLLARPGDPAFVAACHDAGTQCGSRVVAKAHAHEKVGVFATRAGRQCVIEYSELSPERAEEVDPATGTLAFNWSNICMHYFSVAWLQEVHQHLGRGCAYHVANKQIPSKDGPVAGIKLELFIFDVFSHAERTTLVEVARDCEFAPVKNAPGSATDSPDTARAALLSLHRRWVVHAGGDVTHCPEGPEVSPLLSCAGEGLGALCAGVVFDAALVEALQRDPLAVKAGAAAGAVENEAPRCDACGAAGVGLP